MDLDDPVAWYWPEEDLIVLYFTQSRGGITCLRLESEVDRFLIHGGEDFAEPIPDAYAPFVGSYHLGKRVFKVLIKNGHLAVDIPHAFVMELKEPDSGGLWKVEGAPLSFVQKSDGAVSAMKIHEGEQVTELLRGED